MTTFKFLKRKTEVLVMIDSDNHNLTCKLKRERKPLANCPSVACVASKRKKSLASDSSSKMGKENVVEVEDNQVLEELEVEDIDAEDLVEEVEGASLSNHENNHYNREGWGNEKIFALYVNFFYSFHRSLV